MKASNGLVPMQITVMKCSLAEKELSVDLGSAGGGLGIGASRAGSAWRARWG
jgi:hypothetical protein